MVDYHDNKILAEIRKKDDDFGAGETWLPGGHVDAGETSEDTLLREMKEELGITPLKYSKLCSLDWNYKGETYQVDYFVCTEFSGTIVALEAAELVWLGFNELDKLEEGVDRDAAQMYIESLK